MDVNDPAALEVRTMRGPETTLWSEWALLHADLVDSLRKIELWHDAATGGSTEIATSLFRDAIVTFASCFDNSVQIHLDSKDIYAAHVGGMEFFDWLLSMRHSWVAHRHGPARQCSVGCWADRDGNIRGDCQTIMIFTGPTTDTVEQLKQFVQLAVDAAEIQLKAAKSAALAKFNALSPHAVKRLPIAQTTTLNPDDHRTGRKRFVNRKCRPKD